MKITQIALAFGILAAFSFAAHAQTVIFFDGFENDSQGYWDATNPDYSLSTTGSGGAEQIAPSNTVTGADGNNLLEFGLLGGNSSASITLTTTNGFLSGSSQFAANTTYTLTALIAPSTNDDLKGILSLVDGTTVTTLASYSVSAPSVTANQMKLYTVTFDTASNPSVVGHTIQIALEASQGTDVPYTRQVFFDDVTLTATPDITAPSAIFFDGFENDSQGYWDATNPDYSLSTTGSGGAEQIAPSNTVTGADGNNLLEFGLLGGNSSASITLTTTNGFLSGSSQFAANTTYTLTALIAPSTNDDLKGILSLVDGTTITTLASYSVSAPSVTANQMKLYTVIFDTASNPSVVGHTIQIALEASQGTDVPYTRQVFFDDVTLTAEPDSTDNPPGNTQQRSLVGYNNNGLGEFFTDAVKQGDPSFSTLANVADDAAVCDSNGWPLEDAELELNRNFNLLPGTYTMSFNGEASVYPSFNFFQCQWIVAGDPHSPYTKTLPLGAGYNASTNTTTAQMVVTAFGGNDGLTFVNTARNDGSGQAGITNLHLYKPTSSGSTTSFSPSVLFVPSSTAGYTDYDYFRFMAGTNWCLIQNWSDRVRPGHPADTRVLPSVNYYGYTANPGPEAQTGAIEYEVAWCNQLNKDLYINIPFMATDAYITNLAEAIAFGTDGVNPYASPQSNPTFAPLNSNLHVYIEYSNEVWNFGFSQYNECTAVAETFPNGGNANGVTIPNLNFDNNYNGSDFSEELVCNYLASRIVSTSNDFRAVFGNGAMPGTSVDPRIRPILEWQYDNYNDTAQLELGFIFNWYNNGDGRAHVSNPEPPSYYLWGAGAALYYVCNFSANQNPDPTDVASTPTLLNDIFDSSMPETGTGDSDWNYRTRGTVAWAKYFGLHSIAYEGGMGVGGDGMGTWNATTPTAAAVARTDSRATAPEETSLNEWTQAGGDAYTFGTYDQFNGNPSSGPLELGIQAYTASGYSVPAINQGTVVPGTISGLAQSYDYFKSEDAFGAYRGDTNLFLVNAPSAGTYPLTINYASGSSTTNYMLIAVNGVLVTPSGGLALPNNGDVQGSSTPINVTLNAGQNGIRVYLLSGGGINLSGITLAQSVGMNYAAWAAKYFATSAGASSASAPQNDGVPNPLKYLCGIDPTAVMNAADWDALSNGALANFSGAQYLSLTYRQRSEETGLK